MTSLNFQELICPFWSALTNTKTCFTILHKEKQLYIQQLKIDEKQKLENLIQPQIEKLTKQKQEILKMIQKDPEQYQTDNFKFKLDFEIKHKNSKFWQVTVMLVTSWCWRLNVDDNFGMLVTKFWCWWHLWDVGARR